jgi:hypothetical protein
MDDVFLDDIGSFPMSDTFRVITVPKNDPFDISKHILHIPVSQEMMYILESYPLIYGHRNSTDPIEERFLGPNASSTAKNVIKELCLAFSNPTKEE